MDIKIVKIPILTELTPQQVILIKLLESIKAFDIKSGSVTVHFGPDGTISKVDKIEHFKPWTVETK